MRCELRRPGRSCVRRPTVSPALRRWTAMRKWRRASSSSGLRSSTAPRASSAVISVCPSITQRRIASSWVCRVDAGEVLERVGRVRVPVRLGDDVVLVDQHHRRDVRDRIQLGEEMLGVDQHRIGDPVGAVTDVVADRVGRLVDGDGDHLEAVLGEFVVEYLPTWQVDRGSLTNSRTRRAASSSSGGRTANGRCRRDRGA